MIDENLKVEILNRLYKNIKLYYLEVMLVEI